MRPRTQTPLFNDAGLRRGEMLALHWTDLDFKRGTMVVRHNIVRGTLDLTKGRSEDEISMTARLCAALQAARHDRGRFVLANGRGNHFLRFSKASKSLDESPYLYSSTKSRSRPKVSSRLHTLNSARARQTAPTPRAAPGTPSPGLRAMKPAVRRGTAPRTKLGAVVVTAARRVVTYVSFGAPEKGPRRVTTRMDRWNPAPTTRYSPPLRAGARSSSTCHGHSSAV